MVARSRAHNTTIYVTMPARIQQDRGRLPYFPDPPVTE